jgi:hypothetical protein
LINANAEQLVGAAANGCAGEAWQFTIDHVPYVNAPMFVSNVTQGVFQSRGAGQNVVVAVMKLRPKPGFTDNARIYYQTFVIDPNTTKLSFNVNSFQEAGEVQP